MSVSQHTFVRFAGVTVLLLTQLILTEPAATASSGLSCSDASNSFRYLVVFDKGTLESTAQAEIHSACGENAIYYPQISVAVANSADPDFLDNIGADRAFSAQREAEAARGTTRSPITSEQIQQDTFSDGLNESTDLTGAQWDMRSIGARRTQVGHSGNPRAVVGVLDSGIDPHHPDLAAALDSADSTGCVSGVADPDERAWAPSNSAHGTHIAGTVAAADDGKGTTGVAPDARLASVKVVDDAGKVSPEAAVCGLLWAADKRMPIANTSWLVNPRIASCANADKHKAVHEALARAVEYSTASGTTTIAAGSNDAANLSMSPPSGEYSRPTSCETLPGSLRDVVTVSAVGRTGIKAGYSSYGLGVIDITAPGGDDDPRGDGCVLSTVPGGYGRMCGTSTAAPHVSGVAALLASREPAYTAGELRTTLFDQARPVNCPTNYDLTGDGSQDAYCAGYRAYNGFYGHGMIDASAAVAPDKEEAQPALDLSSSSN